ncbi:MAG: hypothetical protein ACFE8Z_08175 [Candidatus Hermodarchaeota archaeon]
MTTDYSDLVALVQRIMRFQTRVNHRGEAMIISRKCPKCGDDRIAGPHRLQAQHHVAVDLPGFATATLESFTCINCGYTEIYSDKRGLDNIRRAGRFVLAHSEPRLAYCTSCGAKIRPGDSMCYECGAAI